MKKLGLSVMAMLISTSVIAADKPFSAELMLGVANQETKVRDSFAIDDSSALVGVRGTFIASKHFALETALVNYGEAVAKDIDFAGDTITDKMQSSSFSIGAKIIIPLNETFSFNSRFGFARWKYKVTETDSSLPNDKFTLSDNGIDPYVGIELKISQPSGWVYGLEYSYLKMGVSSMGVDFDHRVNNVAATLGYSF